MLTAHCLCVVILLTSVAYGLPTDRVSKHASGSKSGVVKQAASNQVARPDEGLVMHCNVTGKRRPVQLLRLVDESRIVVLQGLV